VREHPPGTSHFSILLSVIFSLQRFITPFKHVDWDNPKHKYKLGKEWIESSPEEKD